MLLVWISHGENVIKLTCFVCWALLVIMAPKCWSQEDQDYERHIVGLQKLIPEWEGQIDAIDPAQLAIPYTTGKLIEDNKTILKQNLDLAFRYTSAIRAQHHLSAEIELYGLLREVHSTLNDLSDVLAVIKSQKAATEWAEGLATIGNGPLNQEEQFQIGKLDVFADDLERRCRLQSTPTRPTPQ